MRPSPGSWPSLSQLVNVEELYLHFHSSPEAQESVRYCPAPLDRLLGNRTNQTEKFIFVREVLVNFDQVLHRPAFSLMIAMGLLIS